MRRPKLTNAVVKAIFKAIDKLFDKAKYRLLGRSALPKQIVFGPLNNFQPAPTDDMYNLPSLYERTAIEERNHKPDPDTLEHVTRLAGGFLDAERARAKVHTVKAVEDFLWKAKREGIKTDVKTVLGGELADVWKSVSNKVETIVNTEANKTKNLSILDSVSKINAASGIQDPVVGWFCVHDDVLCSTCKRLHLMPDGVTPRLWYLSECQPGYGNKNSTAPSLSNLHPNDRCSLFTLLPGYGFDAAGNIVFKHFGFDALKDQRKED